MTTDVFRHASRPSDSRSGSGPATAESTMSTGATGTTVALGAVHVVRDGFDIVLSLAELDQVLDVPGSR